MRLAAALVGATLVVAGCVRSSAVTCDDGRTCPSGTRCDDVHVLCVSEPQATVCASLAEGDPCDAAGVSGICDRGYCVPGCGDGVQGVNERDDSLEQCDDGNFASRDGCSSRCELELPGWAEVVKPGMGRARHVAGYHEALRQLVVLGGIDAETVLSDQWTRDEDGNWSVVPSTPIGPRRSAAMAYDSDRDKLMLFGGVDHTGTPKNDLWELDASGWKQVVVTGSGPTPRSSHGMVYDTVRGQLIVFGGATTTQYLADTWTFDPQTSTWTEHAIAGPPARADFGMAWDGSRVVVFGGLSPNFTTRGDTWVLDPAVPQWTRLHDDTDPGQPPRRYGVAMASREPGKVMIAGGFIDGVFDALSTWELVGSTWNRFEPTGAAAPAGRALPTLVVDPHIDAPDASFVLIGGAAGTTPEPHRDIWHLTSVWTERSSLRPVVPEVRVTSMAYDERAHETVMFGGLGLYYDDTWTFSYDGAEPRWTLRQQESVFPLPSCPSGTPGLLIRRALHMMAYDSARNVTVMFGGLRECDGLNSDTHEWSRQANQWTWVNTPGPAGRITAGFAYDPNLGVTVLFGGFGAMNATGRFADTWEYNGTWTVRANAGGPGGRGAPAMTYDPSRGHIVMVDDQDGSTWGYIDRVWTQLPIETRITPARGSASLVYDAKLGLVLFGGGTLTSDQRYSDLWRLAPGRNNWELVTPIGASPFARATALVADPCRNELVMFGGYPRPGHGLLGDTWLFRYRSLTPDEVCDNDIDDDDDLQVDMLDPDCVERCIP